MKIRSRFNYVIKQIQLYIQSWLGYFVRARDYYYYWHFNIIRGFFVNYTEKKKERETRTKEDVMTLVRGRRPDQKIVNGISPTGISRQGREEETPPFLQRRSIKVSSSPCADGLISIIYLPSRWLFNFSPPEISQSFYSPLT